ncbi:MAG: hypothetical protein EOP84_11960, partial [Verrucomicrobiaceae bacterium]
MHLSMTSRGLFLVLFFSLGLLPLRAWDAVVAIRYLKIKGKSHAALYLFTGDGKLVRKLTDPAPHQDAFPVFSPDGKRIIFTRRLADGGGDKLFIVDRKGGKARALDGEPPDWYAARRIGRYFDDRDMKEVDAPAEASSDQQKPAASETEQPLSDPSDGTVT